MNRIVNYLLVLNFSLLLIFFCSKQSFDKKCVALVNNEIITVSEFKQLMRRNRAMIYSYFKNNYNAEVHANFWTTKYGDEIPIERLKERTLNECIRIKVQQILAKKKNITDDISYSGFIKRYQMENEKRKKAVKNKKIIYGPVTFNKHTYFNYTFSMMIKKLKQRLAEDKFTINESELREYYEEHKEKYKSEDIIEVKKISAYFYEPNSAEPLMSRSAAKTIIERFQDQIIKTDDLLTAIKNTADLKISIENQVFDQSTAFTDDRLYSELKETATTLSVGEVSSIVEDEFGFHILKCIKREEGGYISFKEIRESIRSNLIDEKYNQLIDKLTDKAKVKINNSLYNSIKEI